MISNIFKPKKQQLIQESQQNITLGKLVKFSHYETIFKYSFFAVLFVISLYSLDVIQFQQFLKEKNLRRFDWTDLKWLVIGLILIHITKIINGYLVFDYVSKSLDKKYIGLDRQLRVQKIIKWIYDTFYYSVVTIFAYIVFRDEKWFPSQLGGTKFTETMYDFPNMPDNPWVPFYYMIQTSSHIHALLLLMIHGTKIELKYWEYLLHHFLAVSLLYFSTIYNCESIGIVVLVLHDISDIFLAYGRTYADIGKNKILVYMSFSAIQISWLYTRVYVFPIKIYDIIVNHPGFSLYWENTKHALYNQVGLMIVLFGMHIYWTIFMVKVGIGIFSAGKYKNVYDNRENKLDNKKEK
ncbi:unnamed protein product [Paramecium pentaurelia]|uniref:TLC domain-containing protein n=1 Tax=Paramecium pentaurelia TaxID=43138 RepID=A0A8S1WJD5_9CILI|nr:unnamed protein product [Paramecium pentaurelia]